MRVSHYELHVTCKRAFAGLGFPDGVDEDAAHMVSWSELQGLRGLERLEGSLEALDRTCSGRLAPPLEREGAVRVDGNGQSVLAIGSTAVDLATVLAGDQGKADVILDNCRDPELAVALAVRASGHGHHVRLRWRSGDRIHIFDAEDSAQINSISAEDAEPTAENVLHIAAWPASSERKEAPGGEIRWSLSPERARAVLATGIDVPEELWASLKRYGQRMLVPATDDSRVRGAGGGDANE